MSDKLGALLSSALVPKDYSRLRWRTLDDCLSDAVFWEEEFQDTSQLPLHFATKMKGKEEFYNPYNRIVGHEKDKELSRRNVDQFVKSLVDLQDRLAALKKQGYSEEEVIDMVRRELTMPIIFRLGPYGSSKTIQQEAEREYLQLKKESLGLPEFDFIATRNDDAPQGFKIHQLRSPNGKNYCDNFQQRKETKEFLGKALMWGSIGTVSAGMAIGLGELILQYWWEASYFGYDWIEWIFLNYASLVPDIALAGIAGAAVSIARTVSKMLKKDKKDDPVLLSKGGETPHVYISKNETVSDLIGKYLSDLKDSPQFKLKQADMLRAHQSIFMVENLGDLSDEVQGTLAQVLEEKVIEFGGLPRGHRKLIYTLMSINVNTEKLPYVKESLRNRMNYAKILNVLNEVERDSDVVIEENGTGTVISSAYIKRNRFNERHFGIAVLAKTINGIGGQPWKKEGYNELVSYCSRLADNSNQMRISRRVIGLIKTAEDIRSSEEERTGVLVPYVELRHVVAAENQTKSITQAVMETKLKDYMVTTSAVLKHESVVGRVNVALTYHDAMLKGLGSDVPEEIYEYIEKEDYVGYTCPISATALKLDQSSSKKGGLQIVAKDNTLDRDYYVSALKMLFQRDKVDLDDYKISISIPSLKDDDSILAGAYVAISSAIYNTPVRQDTRLALKLLETGEVTSLGRLNLRILDVGDSKSPTVVSAQDFDSKILDKTGASLYPDVKISKVSNTSELMELISK